MTPTLRHRSDLTGSEVWEGDCRAVAEGVADGSCSLAILDGPYGLRKAAWDRLKVADLPKWYAPHLDDVGRVCAPSASLYVWNTAEGWAALHPGILARGWTFRALVAWDKTIASLAGKGVVMNRTWPSTVELCGFYQREAWAPSTCAGSEIAYAAGADERNWVRVWLGEEWTASELRRSDADKAMGTNGMAGHYFGASQWSLPTWEAYQTLAAYAAKHGKPRDRPYLVHPDYWPAGGLRAEYDHLRATYDHLRAEYDHLRATYDHLRAEYDHLRATYDHLRAEYDHLRAEYEASRPAFTCPMGVGNVWRHLPVVGAGRLRNDKGATLHSCQKPLAFADRILRASSRPGESVWVPFGGTLREAVAAERIARADPAEARRVITAELNQDGVDYIGPALRQLRGEGTQRRDPRQGDLFGGAP